MTYHRICNKSNTKGDTIGAGTEHTSGAPELTPAVSGVHAAHVFQLHVVTFLPLL